MFFSFSFLQLDNDIQTRFGWRHQNHRKITISSFARLKMEFSIRKQGRKDSDGSNAMPIEARAMPTATHFRFGFASGVKLETENSFSVKVKPAFVFSAALSRDWGIESVYQCTCVPVQRHPYTQTFLIWLLTL